MTDLRQAARGRPCMVRLPGCANPETVVLAHFRMIGISGAGMKSPDLLGAWACHRCHDLIDRRASIANLTQQDVRLAHLEGVLRTQATLIAEEVVTW